MKVALGVSPKGVIQINEQISEDDQSKARAGKDSETLERAIKQQSKYFNR